MMLSKAKLDVMMVMNKVLMFQAAMFHLPRILWKHSEGGLMKMLVGDLTDPMMLIRVTFLVMITIIFTFFPILKVTFNMILSQKSDRGDRIQFIKKYFKETTKTHGGYAAKFFLCEVLCFVNVIGQMYLTDKFLGNTFLDYGSKVFEMTMGDPEGRSDPMNMVFPKVPITILW